MNRSNRLWIFFVIVAVGLVLSWGQVGREESPRVATRDGAWLDTEVPCTPLEAPCAAYGSSVALVLGPERPGTLRLEAVGDDNPRLGGASVFTRGGGRSDSLELGLDPAGPAQWTLDLPDISKAATAEFRVYLERPAVQAAFPLKGP
jgi:hypothetical protein